jgi:4-azaleucine resistance transporter AzlC
MTESPARSARREFIEGLFGSVGAALGYLPVGISFGALAAHAGWDLASSLAMSAGVYAAAAQGVAVDGLGHQSAVVVITLMLLINLRHFPISLASAPIFNRFPLRHRLVLAVWLTDEVFALDVRQPTRTVGFYYGVHLSCWLMFLGGTLLGAVVGQGLPTQWIEFALPALFIALAVDNLRTYPSRRIPLLIILGVLVASVSRLAGTLAAPVAIVLLIAAYAVIDYREGAR